EALLVTFGAFSKVTRRKGGTASRHYRRNGYTPPYRSHSPKLAGNLKIAFWNIKARIEHFFQLGDLFFIQVVPEQFIFRFCPLHDFS
ncbi:hypothetical protein, partial [Pseudomonas sp. AF32]|uniref:hypothetical protein n=1 Tax=Pseudomonas sp. AF32 TaxID=554390 RepID=UPI001EED42AC